jgi:hypothetical protein
MTHSFLAILKGAVSFASRRVRGVSAFTLTGTFPVTFLLVLLALDDG